MTDYKVTDTREVQNITQAGTPVSMYRVWLVTERGATGVIDVLPSDWNESALPAILQEKAAELDLAFKVSGV